MTKEAKELLLNETVGNTNVSLDTILNNYNNEKFTTTETSAINRQYCKLVVNKVVLTIAQIENFWKYVDVNLRLSDWIFLVGAQCRFDVSNDSKGIDKLLGKDISRKLADGTVESVFHCKIIIKTFRKNAEEWRAYGEKLVASGNATFEEIELVADSIVFREEGVGSDRNVYKLIIENLSNKEI